MNTKCRVKHRSHVVSIGESDNNDKRIMAAFSGKKIQNIVQRRWGNKTILGHSDRDTEK